MASQLGKNTYLCISTEHICILYDNDLMHIQMVCHFKFFQGRTESVQHCGFGPRGALVASGAAKVTLAFF